MNNMCQLWHYPNRFVAIYLIARFVIWTVVIWLTQPTLPLDVLEHLAWGKEWRLVYSSHPGLPAWINEAVHITFSGNHLALSAISPFFSCVAIWAVWQLARDTLKNNNTAAIAALSLEGVFYFNISAIEFNHNVAQLTAITLFFFDCMARIFTRKILVAGSRYDSGFCHVGQIFFTASARKYIFVEFVGSASARVLS
jgi:4-amino-4-deoxy-L-arabinose transferase-like glycosyltransferase